MTPRPAKKRPVKKRPVKKAPAKKSPAKKATAKKATAKKRPAKKRPVKKRSPAKKAPAKKSPVNPETPAGVLNAVEAFIEGSEMSGPARVKAEIAKKLAKDLDSADPPTAPALARELQAALVGILPQDGEEHDDWTTRLGATSDRDPKKS